MRLIDYRHLTGQHRAKVLQSVAITVGVGKTHLASALGHIAIRRRISVHFSRADKLFTRLRAARLDNTLDAEMRRLTRVELLILDDFALRPLDATQTATSTNSSSNATAKPPRSALRTASPPSG
jgi:hypothetical protein